MYIEVVQIFVVLMGLISGWIACWNLGLKLFESGSLFVLRVIADYCIESFLSWYVFGYSVFVVLV